MKYWHTLYTSELKIDDLLDRFDLQRIHDHMHISLKHSYLYYETPKVACSTLKKRLFAIEYENTPIKPPDNIHDRAQSPMISPAQLNAHQLNDILQNKRFFKFCFVRDPFSRALSAYLDKIVRKEPQLKIFLEINGYKEEDVEKEISFLEFLEKTASNQFFQMDPHWMPQVKLLFIDKIDYSFIGRFENFESDWDLLMKMLLPSLNTNKNAYSDISMRYHKTGANEKLQTYYTDDTIDLVKTIYKDDFECLEYDMIPYWM